jgi:uncharacterized membrane protein YraQ (UPF0718 family)
LRFSSAKRLALFLPKTRAGGVAVGLAAGLLLPTCECGSVPVAQRLLGKGIPTPAALTYMLAAPVINPVVLISTYAAFRGDLKMVLARQYWSLPLPHSWARDSAAPRPGRFYDGRAMRSGS